MELSPAGVQMVLQLAPRTNHSTKDFLVYALSTDAAKRALGEETASLFAEMAYNDSLELSPKKGRFNMLNPDWNDKVHDEIDKCPHPEVTRRVWCRIQNRVDSDTFRCTADREELARASGVSVNQVSKAIGVLSKSLAVLPHREGGKSVYLVNPLIGWNGNSKNAEQEKAAAFFELVMEEFFRKRSKHLPAAAE